MDAIFNTYLVDRFKFAMLMYKYENSFRVIDKSIRDSVNSKLFFADKTELQESIDEIISVAYTEIVEEKGFEWIYEDLKYEKKIVRELKKMKEMKNE